MTAFPYDAPPPIAPPPGPRKPGTVTTAQVMLWVQFGLMTVFLVLSCSVVAVFPSDAADFTTSERGSGDNGIYIALVLLGVFLVVAVLFAVLAPKIGARRRWAHVLALVLLPVFALALVMFIFTLALAQPDLSAAFGLFVLLVLTLAPAVATFACLLTPSARRWCSPQAVPAEPPLAPQY